MSLTKRVSDKAMQGGLKVLNRWSSSQLIDRARLRKPSDWIIRNGTEAGFKAATVAGRQFAKSSNSGTGSKPKQAGGDVNLFDLTPTDEQQMLVAGAKEFAAAEFRPIAESANHASAAPEGLIASAAELGVTMLNVPEALGGVTEDRSAVTATLMYEALAHGDMGLAFASLAPAAVSTALGLWGDATQQGTYLPEFVGGKPPLAALAIQESRPLFDPLKLDTKAKNANGGYVLSGAKSLVPNAKDNELFVIAAELEGKGPALFIVEAGTAGLSVEPEPAMGLRAASTGRVILENVNVEAGALIADGDPEVYREAIRLGRVAWSALATGTSQAVLDYVIPYVKERKAFGEPVGQRQSVAFMVSDIAIEGNGLRLATYRAASRADSGLDFAREAAIARRLTADKGMWIGSAGVQLLGGHGYVQDHPVERWYRDLRAAGIYEGGLLV